MKLSPFLQRTRRPVPQAFCFALDATVRIAVINAEFREARNLRHFSVTDAMALQAWRPEVLVLPLSAASFLAESTLQGRFDLPSLSTAIVVLTSLAETPIDRECRDRLWRAFAVPVFEQLMGWDGNAIARECEVHDGLHIDDAAGKVRLEGGELMVSRQAPERTGLAGEIVTAHCECGAETPRLRNLWRVEKETKAKPAAA